MKAIASLFSMVISARALYASTDIAVPGTVGNAALIGPFSLIGDSSERYQQVYGASAFSAISQGGLITALGFNLSSVQSIGGTLADIQIDFSTTSKPVDGLSTTFSANVGADDAIAYTRGVLPIVPNNPGAPPGFGVLIPLDRPFLYNPAAGNLLMDVRCYQGSCPAFAPGPFHAANDIGDTVSSLSAFGVGSVGNATGTAGTVGLLTGFVITPVPEPDPVFLLLAGVSIMAILIRASTPRRSRLR
jgi:hypothetical protein